CRTACDLQVDRLVVTGVARHDVVYESGPVSIGERIGEPYAVEAALQSPQVLTQTERVARIDGNQFVDAVAENENAVQHRNPRFFERHEFTVEVNDIRSHLYVFYLKSSLIESQPRPNIPASGTDSNATIGTSA